MTQPAALGKSSTPTRGISATLRRVFLDSEIGYIVADSATANQLPQSGIHPRKMILFKFNPSNDCCMSTVILTD